jgi:hypothetical protein
MIHIADWINSHIHDQAESIAHRARPEHRQSTKTLFRNPSGRPEAEPGDRIRTRITSADQALDFEVALTDPRAAVKRVRIAYEVPGENGRTEVVEFTLECEGAPDE